MSGTFSMRSVQGYFLPRMKYHIGPTKVISEMARHFAGDPLSSSGVR